MTGWWNRRTASEAACVLAIVVAGAMAGASYHKAFRASGAKEDFLQREFSAAVALACGRGFVDIGYSLTPELDEFLALKRDAIDCATLPAAPDAPPNLTQGLYRYLMSTVAMVWKVKGVSWSALSPLFGLVYGVTLAAAYGLFRLGMGRVVALAMTFALGISAIHLGYLPHLRDYAKAPFMLALMLIMARFARDPLERRRTLATALVFGAVLGIGFGFRNDLLIVIVPWIGVVLFGPRGGLFRNLPLKAGALVLSIATFVVVAWPIFAAYGKGSNSGHVALLGLMAPFDSQLGVGAASYSWGYHYSDSVASTIINSYRYRTTGHSVSYLSAEYDRAMVEYILQIIRHWPADVLIRAYGAVLAVIEFPLEVGVRRNGVPLGLVDPRIVAIYDWQIGALGLLQGWGAYIVGAALVLLAAASRRLAFALLILVLYFAGYPAIQFSIRHFFHLEFIVWWALGFLAQRAYETLRQRPSALGFTVPSTKAGVRNGLVFAAIAAAGVMLPVAGLRAYQQEHLRRMLSAQYLGAPRVPLVAVAEPAGEGQTLFRLPELWATRNPAQAVNAAYVIAEFSPADCSGRQVTAKFRYEARTPATDFSHDVFVKVVPGTVATEVFFPGYLSNGWTQLVGVEVPSEDAPCLSRLSRVADGKLPELLIGLNLAPHWRQGKLYQTLVDFERPDDGDGVPGKVYSSPDGFPTAGWGRAVRVVETERIAAVGQGVVSANPDRWTLHGRAPSEFAYLLQFQPRVLPAGSKLVVEGEIAAGALSIGLLKNARWAGVVNLVSVGPFVATIAAPEAGTYQLVIADFSKSRWVDQYWPAARRFIPDFLSRPATIDAAITRAGWILGSRN